MGLKEKFKKPKYYIPSILFLSVILLGNILNYTNVSSPTFEFVYAILNILPLMIIIIGGLFAILATVARV